MTRCGEPPVQVQRESAHFSTGNDQPDRHPHTGSNNDYENVTSILN